MTSHLTIIAFYVSFGAASAIAQTADHAPTKPAADAAARYDKSLERDAPANSMKNSDDGSSGASSGTADPLAGSGEPSTADREGGAPNSTMGKPK